MKIRKYLFFTLLLVHLPFLFTDPNIVLDLSRGAFTDEGLYLYQLRNLFMFGIFDMSETDGLLKTPFYNLLMALPVAFNKLWLVRLIVLTAVSFVMFEFWKKILGQNIPILSLLLLVFSQSTIFGHLHLAMSEVIVFAFLMLSVLATYCWKESNQYLGVFFICVAVCCKIQYLDLLIILVPYSLVLKRENWSIKKLIFVLSPLWITLALFVLFKNDVIYMLDGQTGGKFQNFGNWIFRIKVNLKNLSVDSFNIFMWALLVISSGFVIAKFKKVMKLHRNILLCLWLIFIVESHKLIFIYLPQRYLFIWFALIICIIVFQMYLLLNTYTIPKNALTAIAVIFIGCFVFRYMQFFKARTFEMQTAKSEILNNVPEKSVFVGPWAPSLSFGTALQCHTAWKGYYENAEYWQSIKEAYLITERDFDDNKGLFKGEVHQSDMMDSFTIKYWDFLILKRTID